MELRGCSIAVTSVHPIGTETEFGDVSASLSQGSRPQTTGEIRQTARAHRRVHGAFDPAASGGGLALSAFALGDQPWNADARCCRPRLRETDSRE